MLDYNHYYNIRETNGARAKYFGGRCRLACEKDLAMNKILFMASLLLLAGCAQNPAQNVPMATVSSGSPTPAVSSPAPSGSPTATTKAVYQLDGKAGLVGFTGSKVTGKHDGGFKEYKGQVTLVDNDPTKSSVEVEIKVASLFTDDEDLVEHLNSDEFFDSKKFPTSTFKSKSIVKKGDDFEVTGDLTMHGITKTIGFPAKIGVTEKEVTVTSEFSINRFDFAMQYPGKADNLIRKEVVIRLDLKAPKK